MQLTWMILALLLAPQGHASVTRVQFNDLAKDVTSLQVLVKGLRVDLNRLSATVAKELGQDEGLGVIPDVIKEEIESLDLLTRNATSCGLFELAKSEKVLTISYLGLSFLFLLWAIISTVVLCVWSIRRRQLRSVELPPTAIDIGVGRPAIGPVEEAYYETAP